MGLTHQLLELRTLSDERRNVFKNLKKVHLPSTQPLKTAVTWLTVNLQSCTLSYYLCIEGHGLFLER